MVMKKERKILRITMKAMVITQKKSLNEGFDITLLSYH
jgi:hypothetical protein